MDSLEKAQDISNKTKEIETLNRRIKDFYALVESNHVKRIDFLDGYEHGEFVSNSVYISDRDTIVKIIENTVKILHQENERQMKELESLL